LPSRIYKKLSPFDNVKFGVSSRVYVFRCPQLEKKLAEEEDEKDNKFIQVI
jgi:hypothetical protein